MAGQGFNVNVTSNEVDVKQDGSPQSGSRGTAGVGTILAAAYFFFLTIVVDKHGRPGLWHDLKTAQKGSFGFYFVLALVTADLAFCGYLLLTGVRFFFPAGEELVCDRTTFTYSRIPLLSFFSRWKRESFPIAGVSELFYGVIVEGNPEKNIEDTYGLDFYVADKHYKILGGLEADDAETILKKLRALGVDVIMNQNMSAMVEKVNQTQEASRLGL